MAVLGNLRKNSFVLIAVIGMALFAFVIAGVFDGSGFQSQEPGGKVNGEELSITDFRNQLDVLKKSLDGPCNSILYDIDSKYIYDLTGYGIKDAKENAIKENMEKAKKSGNKLTQKLEDNELTGANKQFEEEVDLLNNNINL